MILWDANTRRKNDKKKLKDKLRKIIRDKEHEDDTRKLIVALHERDENDDMFHITEVPWTQDYEFKPMNFETDSETPEDDMKSMNDIFDNLFSYERLQRKFFLINRKRQKTTAKIIKKFKKKTKEEKELVDYLKELQESDPEYQKRLQKYKEENKMNKKMSKKFEKIELQKRRSEYEKKMGSTIQSETQVEITPRHSEGPSGLKNLIKLVKTSSIVDQEKARELERAEKSKQIGNVVVKRSSKNPNTFRNSNFKMMSKSEVFDSGVVGDDSPVVVIEKDKRNSVVIEIEPNDISQFDKESETTTAVIPNEEEEEFNPRKSMKEDESSIETKELQELSEFFQ